MKTRAWLTGAIAALLAAELFSFGDIRHTAASIASQLAAMLAALCALSALLGCVYTLLAGALTRRFFARAPREPRHCPPVTIVKPLHGTEQALFANLASFCEQRYDGPIQFLFGVHDRNDPALRTVEALCRAFPHARVTTIADARLYGPNRKIANLVNMLPAATHDLLIFADSDVSVGPDYVRHVVGELEQPGVGLVTCAYRGRPDPGFWPRIESLVTNHHFLPGVVTGLALKLARPCFGQTIAMRRTTLDAIGGLTQFAHHLAEDHAIGEAVRAHGERVSVPPFVIEHGCVETSAKRLATHELRWSRTIRAVDPLGHLGLIVTHPFALALLSAVLSNGAWWSWALVPIALAARLAAKYATDRAVRQPVRDPWLLPLADLVAFGVFVASFSSSRVIWRGLSFDVDRDGRLCPAPEKRPNT
ncbi:bacteriohopanetetrol glucosamine biosynthesis glycosyltransferase HpnI [Burkholderia sp. TSV86]|uniref:bacteriohopanetetrol glucosamine biosynthesis glycosyltransferase HpnI n=1 Tax=Burkholderia sp. TSV86 TaxID=1385594 RepID=UPI000757C956|nr:bacteriohopanetetrol glucosamine biosynthesis glycosyltransferase HpnI [Burkholderia sp. TSV86]KVE33281.1 glucosyltransferase [Burkholderia sp. TSV86]